MVSCKRFHFFVINFDIHSILICFELSVYTKFMSRACNGKLLRSSESDFNISSKLILKNY